MNQLRSLSLKHKLIVALCAIVSCFMLSASMLLPPATDARADETPEMTHELTGVTIAQNTGWVFTDASFEENRYLKLITVSVTYKPIGADDTAPTETVALELTPESAGGGTFTAKTGEKVTITFDKSAKTMTATMTAVREGAQFAAGTTELPSEAVTYTTGTRVVNGISAEYIKSSEVTVATDTSIDEILSSIKVRSAYNDGTVDTTATPLADSMYQSVSGEHLFPENYEEDVKWNGNEGTYDKTVTIETSSNYEPPLDYKGELPYKTQVTITDIKLETPISISRYSRDKIAGSLQGQIARSSFNLDRLSVELDYTQSSITVPLTNLPSSWLEYAYYTSTAGTEDSKTETLTTEVKRIDVTFKYNNNDTLIATRTFSGSSVRVSRISIHTPTFSPLIGQDGNKKTTVSWTGSAEVYIGDWNYDELYRGENSQNPQSPQPTVTVYKGATGTNEFDEENPIVSNSNPFAIAESDNKYIKFENKIVTVNFPEPACDYKVVVSLKSGDRNKDFQWDAANQITGGETSTDYSDIVFLVQVDKGTVNPTLQLSTLATDHVYGKDWDKGTVEATIAGTANKLTGWTYKATAEESDKTSTDQFYHLEYYNDKNELVDISKLTDVNKPNVLRLPAGTYHVKVVTHENSRFYASDDPNHTGTTTAKELVIDQKTIKAQNLISTVTYDRINYGLAENLAKIVKVDSGEFKYDDDKPNVPVDIAAPSDMQHVNDYTITLTLQDSVKNNYKWETPVSGQPTQTSVTFTINQRTTHDFNASANGYVYGTENADPNPSHDDTTKIPNFYPKVSDVAYYAIADFDETAKKPKANVTAKTGAFSSWDVGDYVAYYATDYADNAEKTYDDYTLPTAFAKFTVSRAIVSVPTLTRPDGQVDKYDTTAKTFTLNGYDAAKMSYTVAGTSSTGGELQDIVKDKDNVAGVITSIHAGNYTVTVSVDKNHAWSKTDGENPTYDIADKTFPYTIERHELVLDWDNNTLHFNYEQDMEPVKPEFAEDPLFESDRGTVSLTMKIFGTRDASTGEFSNPKDAQGVTEAGTFYYVVEAVNSTDYSLPTKNWVEFVIGKAVLALPETVATGETASDGTVIVKWDGAKLSAVYRGVAFDVENSMTGDGTNGYKHGSNVTIVYKNSAGATITEIKDFGTYTVEFTPTENYIWDGTTEDAADARTPKTLTFVVTKYIVKLDWTWDTANFYTGNGQAPAVSVDKTVVGFPAGNDSLTVRIGVGATSNAAQSSSDKTATYAGNYYAYAQQLLLNEEEAKNYALPTDSTVEKFFTIKKALVTKPTAPTGTFTFGTDTAATFTLNNEAWTNTWSTANSVSLTQIGHTYSVFNGYSTSADTTITTGLDALFNIATGQLTFTNAGTYTLTFALNDSKNYCWEVGQQESFSDTTLYTTLVEITLQRKTITAPSWSEYTAGKKDIRAIERLGDTPIRPNINLPEPSANNPALKVTYGWYTGDGFYGDDTFTAKGRYYVLYTIIDGNTDGGTYDATKNPLNYVWSDSNFTIADNDTQMHGLLGDGNGTAMTYEMNNEGKPCVTLTVNYAITGTVLNLTFGIEDYTFGANLEDGFFNKQLIYTGVDSDKTLLQQDDAADAANPADYGTRFTLTLTITDVTDGKNNIIATLTYNSGSNQFEGDVDALEKHLPWNAGTYKAAFDWRFTDASQLQIVTEPQIFTVKPRPIEVDWFSDENDENSKLSTPFEHSLPYDGDPHTLYAKIKNAPVRGGVNSADGLTLTVALNAAENLPTNVAFSGANVTAHTLYVTAINGNADAAKNFTVYAVNGKDYLRSASLTILQREITVSATTPSTNHIYGDAIDAATEKQFTIAETDTVAQAARAFIVVKIWKVEGANKTEVTSHLTPTGTYSIIPEFTNAGGAKNYKFKTDPAVGTFTVDPRPITVAVKSDLSSVYGSAVDKLGDVTGSALKSDVYTITYTGDDAKTAIPDGEKALIFSTLAKKGDVVASSTAAVGDYTIALDTAADKTNANYTVTLAAEHTTYTITPATLKVKVDITIYYGEDLPTLENGGFKMSTGYLTEPKVTGQRNSGIYTIDPNDFVNHETIEILNDSTYKGSFSYAVYDNDTLVTEGKPTLDKDYTLRLAFTNLTCGNYKFVADTNYGKLTVQPLPITVTVKEGIEVTYCESGLAASYLEELNTKDTGYTVTLPDSSYGLTDANAKVQPLDEYSAIFTLKTDALQGDKTNHVVVGGYAVTKTDGAKIANYDLKFINSNKYTVKQATDNVFTATFGSNLSTVFAGEPASGAAAAWTYGTYGTAFDNADNPMTKYVLNPNGSHNAFTVKIQFKSYTDADWKDFDASHYNNGSVTWNNDKYDASILFSRVNQAAHKFNAGYYRVTFTMPATDDYSEATDTRYFRVAKAQLTITPTQGDTVTYGEAYEFVTDAGDNYDTTVEGYKYAEDRSALGDITFEWTTKDYTVGNRVGNNGSIVIADETVYLHDNYTFKFGTAELKVISREVTVQITAKEAYYRFLGDTDEVKNNAGVAFTNIASIVASGSKGFYNNDCPIAIHTAAVSLVGDKYETNNFGQYPIYAVWADGIADDLKASYTIHFKFDSENHIGDWEKTTGILVDGDDSKLVATDLTHAAATYTIKTAQLTARAVGTNTYIYNSQAYGVAYAVSAPNNASVSGLKFKVFYELQLENGSYDSPVQEDPVNVGMYRVSIVYDPEATGGVEKNYEVTVPTDLFLRIDKANIYVQVSGAKKNDSSEYETATIQYGTTLPLTVGWANSLDNLGREESDGYVRFSGYTVSFWDGTGSSAHDIDFNGLLEQESTNKAPITVKDNTFKFTSNYTAATEVSDNYCNVTFDIKQLESRNYNFAERNVVRNLQVVQREVTVKVKGATGNPETDKTFGGIKEATSEYTRTKKGETLRLAYEANWGIFFDIISGWDENNISILKLTLAIPEAQDCGVYNMTPGCTNGNFAITFVDVNGNQYKFAYSEGEPQFVANYIIYKKALTVRVNYGNDKNIVEGTSIQFGDVAPTYKWAFEGFCIDDDYTDSPSGNYQTGTLGNVGYMVGDTLTEYVRWETGAGTYQMQYDLNGLWFKNYTIAIGDPTMLTVERRTIEVAILDPKSYYYNNNIRYNDEAGAENVYWCVVPARVGFTGNGTELTDSDYALTYKENGSGPDVRPIHAGNYQVTVKMNDKNYRFGKTAAGADQLTTALEFTIQEQDIGIGWNPQSLVEFNKIEDPAKTLCAVADFDPTIIEIVSFKSSIIVGGSFQNIDPNAAGEKEAGKYWIGDKGRGLYFTPVAASIYNLELRLHSNDYKLRGADSILLTLTVSAGKVDIRISMDQYEWVYLNPDGIVTVTLQNDNGTSSTVLAPALSYAVVNKRYDEVQALLNGQSFNDLNKEQLDANFDKLGIGYGSFRSARSSDAGIYVVQAQVDGQSGFYVFRVTPKELEVPTISLSADQYTGNPIAKTVSFDNTLNAITISSDNCSALLTGTSGAQLSAMFVGDYTAKLSLTSSNFVWKDDGMVAGKDATVITWSITQGKDVVTFTTTDLTATYGTTTFTPLATSKFNAPIQYGYILKSAVTGTPTDTANWNYSSKPSNAGDYYVIALSTGNNNYTGHYAVTTLKIYQAELYATPYGSMTYGEEFTSAGGSAYGYTVTGFVNGDTVNLPATKKTVTYVCGDAVGTNVWPNAGEYALTLKTKDIDYYGTVIDGLEYANYVVKVSEGRFTVNRKTVTVTVPARSSVYLDALDLAVGNDVTATDNAVLSAITLHLVRQDNTPIPDDARPDVDSYRMTASCSNDNYIVEVVGGTYQVLAKRLTVTFNTHDYEVDSGDEPVNIVGVQGVNGTSSVNEAELLAALTRVFGDGDSVAPNVYGTYTATIRFKSDYADASNYLLTGTLTKTFHVTKKTLDKLLIGIASQEYTGNVLTPSVTYEDRDETWFTDMFEVDFEQADGRALRNAGSYTVTVTIRDIDNYQWLRTEDAAQTFDFVITPANYLIESITVEDWTYGQYDEAVNAPKVVMKFDKAGIATDGSEVRFAYRYTDRSTGLRVAGIPTQAGEYFVSVDVTLATSNYVYTGKDNIAEVGVFKILPAKLAAPTLVTVTEGEGKNDVYTGGTLSARIDGFNSTDMEMSHNALSVDVSPWRVQAVNAGTYTIAIGLKDARNYAWESGADGNGNVVLTWVVNKKKVARPYNDGSKLIVNGKILTYTPAGFDADIMTIEGNQQGYGGTFTATVALKDPVNYEWADGEETLEPFEIEWHVVGSNTVFAIVMGCLGGAAAIAAGVAVVLYFKYRKKKQSEAEAEAVA